MFHSSRQKKGLKATDNDAKASADGNELPFVLLEDRVEDGLELGGRKTSHLVSQRALDGNGALEIGQKPFAAHVRGEGLEQPAR